LHDPSFCEIMVAPFQVTLKPCMTYTNINKT
jgi:hypothetical protein